MYESLAHMCNFEIELKSIETVIHNFESVDDIIMWALATMDTDTLKISPKTINDVKKGIEKPELQWKKIQFIMTKSTYTE